MTTQGDALTDKWRDASAAARRSEHHWPADCLAEAADAYDQARRDLDALREAVRALAERGLRAAGTCTGPNCLGCWMGRMAALVPCAPEANDGGHQ